MLPKDPSPIFYKTTQSPKAVGIIYVLDFILYNKITDI